MMSVDVEALAATLLRAMLDHLPLAIDDIPELPREQAYQVQRAFVRSVCATRSCAVTGFKLSMTSPETQALAAASGPEYGTFTSDMILTDSAQISISDCFEPRLELELQFIVIDDLSPGATRSEIEEKCLVAPGIEVPDSRFRSWFGNLPMSHIVSDLGLAGHVVVGPPVPLQSAVLPEVAGELLLDGRVVAEGVAASVMGDPVVALEWLTQRLQLEGRVLEKGKTVSSGTLCMPVPMQVGDYHAVFRGVGEARLSVVP